MKLNKCAYNQNKILYIYSNQKINVKKKKKNLIIK